MVGRVLSVIKEVKTYAVFLLRLSSKNSFGERKSQIPK